MSAEVGNVGDEVPHKNGVHDHDSDPDPDYDQAWGRESYRLVATLRDEQRHNYQVFSERLQTLHENDRKLSQGVRGLFGVTREIRADAKRSEARLLGALSTLLARMDAKDSDEAALVRAVEAVHTHAREAKADVEALGSQVGKTVAETRSELESIVEAQELVDAKAEQAMAGARRANILVAVRISALLAAGAAMWKFFEFAYKFTH